MNQTDKPIVIKAEHTSSDSLEKLMREHAAYVYTVVRGIIGSGRREDVEECVSDVFVAFWQNPERYDSGKSGVRTYLCAIARHKALDILRRTKRPDISELDDSCSEKPDGIELEDEVLRRLNKDIVLRAVNSLPSRDREIYVRRYYYSQSVKEIARAMTISAKLVENRLCRSKADVRETLLHLKINL